MKSSFQPNLASLGVPQLSKSTAPQDIAKALVPKVSEDLVLIQLTYVRHGSNPFHWTSIILITYLSLSQIICILQTPKHQLRKQCVPWLNSKSKYPFAIEYGLYKLT